ncbi:PEPxxWA-CTERM sorting domain-containing protein [Sphingomonas mesophila]|uniref:PEPxxWA-CTERM sorting domain-containing protein n=1 Tax=Sphingomonas mesophila TaxID=2303576 RepID=UPI001F082E42|nr:PEPxxWA-CTERM sorting domain-containing protein [Sphingomonas mesophila]
MKTRVRHIVLAASLAFTSPAMAATTLNFTGTTAVVPSYSTSSGSLGVTATAYTYTGAPSLLDGMNLSSLTSSTQLSRSVNGIGVCTEGGSAAGTSGECPQVDTNGSTNEALLLNFTGGSNISISNAVLNIVDLDDTLGIYGVALNGTLDFLGFNNFIATGGAGFTSTLTNAGLTQYSLVFNPAVSGFSRYLFTSTRDTADGYRLRSLTIAAVPEPEIWAMLLLGFGAIGFQMRRRNQLRTVTA